MDNKRFYFGLGLLMLAMVGWYFYLQQFVWPQHPEWFRTPAAQTQPAVSSSEVEASPSAAPSTQAAVESNTPSETPSISAPHIVAGQFHVLPVKQPVNPITLGSATANDATYSLALIVDPIEARIDQIVLNQFKATDAKSVYKYQQGGRSSLQTSAVVINGQTVDLSGAVWKLESDPQNAGLAMFSLDIVSGAENIPALRIFKTYTVSPQGSKGNQLNTAAGYEIGLTYGLKNLNLSLPVEAVLKFDGPTLPPAELEGQPDRMVIAGYDKGNQSIEVGRTTPDSFKTTDAKDLAQHEKGYKLLWAGTSGVYFSAIVQAEKPDVLEKVGARPLNLEAERELRDVALSYELAGQKIGAGGSADVPLKLYIGPNERSLLRGDYYSAYPREYSQLLVSGSWCNICAFPWLIDVLVYLLRSFHWLLRDWGLAIIALVLLVRLILHPITKSSQMSMMKMQKMAPEMERLKKKYGDDKEALAKAQFELAKSVGPAQFLGCAPMFLQMPIWIALYTALQTEFSLRQAPFLFTWIHNLAGPDRLITWDAHAFNIPLIGKVASFNLLPIVMGVIFYLQQKYTPKPPATTPEQAQQQKMMSWMSVIFPLMLYTRPSGLNLYILTSSGLGIVESWRIRKHIRAREEAEKQAVIIDVPANERKSARRLREEEEEAKPKQGKLSKWFAELQARAEQAKREAERKKKR